MSTLWDDLEVLGYEVGTLVPVVYGTPQWAKDCKKIRNQAANEKIAGGIIALARLGEKLIGTGKCKILQGTGGLFELRADGVRYYFGRLKYDGLDRWVLLRAENKAGRSEASKPILKSATIILDALQKRLSEIPRKPQ